MIDKDVYILQYISRTRGARDFIVIDNISAIAIVGDAASTRTIPNLNTFYTHNISDFKNKLSQLRFRNYNVIFESYNTSNRIDSNQLIDECIEVVNADYNK